ncbi:MAG: RtcB family protein [Deltaproteobacteria bacterium]|nr:RtcB family protein [Deltaproteobacteria bacterium]
MKLEQLDDNRWRIARQGRMRTDAVVFASEKLVGAIGGDDCLKQIANVATLPGIVGSALAMPDIHGGYGFPIGGVAAFDLDEGVVSPGGVGYDINCGVRLMRTALARADVEQHLEALLHALAAAVPAGLGSRTGGVELGRRELDRVLERVAGFAVELGRGSREELDCIEAGGCIEGADAEVVSWQAKDRGRGQLGTLGSGNHFVEVGYVDRVFDTEAARTMGLDPGAVTVSIHTGSRGLGHQVATDAIKTMLRASERHGIFLPDRQLCCAPLASDEGKQYLAAMAAAANYAFCNRQLIAALVGDAFEHVLAASTPGLGLRTVYDVAHNIAKIERHVVDGAERRLCVHRKGATRAFAPGHPDVPERYRQIGQPVLVPGDMGRSSYVLCGRPGAMEHSFGSSCHGAGRLLSRAAAKKRARGRDVRAELGEKGVQVRAASRETLAEEMPEAYKDVEDVVAVVQGAGLSALVVRLRPLVVVKG